MSISKYLIKMKWLLICIACAFVAACGGGGGVQTTSVSGAMATVGALNVRITGLPVGANANVNISGPGNFSKSLATSQVISPP